MLYIGIDLGTSAVKLTVWDAETQHSLITVQYPTEEAPIYSAQPGWAEQSPLDWWDHIRNAMHQANSSGLYVVKDIKGIGIAYQMHGLVLVDQNGSSIGNSIIWCDSRAIHAGEEIYQTLGRDYCDRYLLNSPGNFTAAKLAWVQQHQPEIFQQIHRIMLPGDYISFRMTGEATTTSSALSEGIFWDYQQNQPAHQLFQQYHWNPEWIPAIRPVFGEHGFLSSEAAHELQLIPGIPVTYKAGDQMNNAWSLGVMEPGQIAATAGTSGVIYAVTDQPLTDSLGRINSFAHVNHSNEQARLGLLMCINGAGILNKWVRQLTGNRYDYEEMNRLAATIQPGADGLFFYPFGNGAERILGNQISNAHLHNIDFNRHSPAHLFRAAQEGVAFAFRYGLDVLREMQVNVKLIKAGTANLFLSDVFIQAFVQLTQTPLELFDVNGSEGAARGAAKGSGFINKDNHSTLLSTPVKRIDPDTRDKRWEDIYQQWLLQLNKKINNS
jgi:xylulokinase